MAIELKEWIDRVFGEPPEFDVDEIHGADEATLVRLTEVFEDPATLLAGYSDEVLKQVLWALGNRELNAVHDPAIEWAVRDRFIRSFEILFREFFAVRCQAVLGHDSEEGNPLNTVCYMWWDLDCWRPGLYPVTQNRMDSAVLASMRSILAIDHVACQESALHGLGHWYWAHSTAVERIIDEFLEREPDLCEALRDYSADARCGCVL